MQSLDIICNRWILFAIVGYPLFAGYQNYGYTLQFCRNLVHIVCISTVSDQRFLFFLASLVESYSHLIRRELSPNLAILA